MKNTQTSGSIDFLLVLTENYEAMKRFGKTELFGKAKIENDTLQKEYEDLISIYQSITQKTMKETSCSMKNTQTKTGFTPGPWYAVETQNGFDILNKERYEADHLWLGDFKGYGTENFTDKKIALANARLAAAAPEMFELLRKGLEDGDPMNWDEVSDLLDKIRQ